MKKILSFSLAVFLIFSLCACSQEAVNSAISAALKPEGASAKSLETKAPVSSAAPDAAESTAIPIASPEKPPEPSPAPSAEIPVPPEESEEPLPPVQAVVIHGDAGKYVRSAFELSGEYLDALENRCNYGYAIAEFISKSADAVSANSMISDLYMPLIEESQFLMEDGFSLSLTDVGYEAFLNADIVSVVTHLSYQEEFETYRVWNMKLTDPGSSEMVSATPQDLYDFTGMSDSGVDLLSATAQCVGNFYMERYKDLSNEFILERYQHTVSPDNLTESEYYLDEDGQLQAIVKIYTIAGAEYYYRTIPIII